MSHRYVPALLIGLTLTLVIVCIWLLSYWRHGSERLLLSLSQELAREGSHCQSLPEYQRMSSRVTDARARAKDLRILAEFDRLHVRLIGQCMSHLRAPQLVQDIQTLVQQIPSDRGDVLVELAVVLAELGQPRLALEQLARAYQAMAQGGIRAGGPRAHQGLLRLALMLHHQGVFESGYELWYQGESTEVARSVAPLFLQYFFDRGESARAKALLDCLTSWQSGGATDGADGAFLPLFAAELATSMGDEPAAERLLAQAPESPWTQLLRARSSHANPGEVGHIPPAFFAELSRVPRALVLARLVAFQESPAQGDPQQRTVRAAELTQVLHRTALSSTKGLHSELAIALHEIGIREPPASATARSAWEYAARIAIDRGEGAAAISLLAKAGLGEQEPRTLGYLAEAHLLAGETSKAATLALKVQTSGAPFASRVLVEYPPAGSALTPEVVLLPEYERCLWVLARLAVRGVMSEQALQKLTELLKPAAGQGLASVPFSLELQSALAFGLIRAGRRDEAQQLLDGLGQQASAGRPLTLAVEGGRHLLAGMPDYAALSLAAALQAALPESLFRGFAVDAMAALTVTAPIKSAALQQSLFASEVVLPQAAELPIYVVAKLLALPELGPDDQLFFRQALENKPRYLLSLEAQLSKR